MIASPLSLVRRSGAPDGSGVEERAFLALSRKFGLGRAAVAEIRVLATLIGATPVALTLSEHAFLRACAERERIAAQDREPLPESTRRAIASLRHKLFAEP